MSSAQMYRIVHISSGVAQATSSDMGLLVVVEHRLYLDVRMSDKLISVCLVFQCLLKDLDGDCL